MEVTCLVLSILALVVATGSAWFLRSRKPSSAHLEAFSDRLQDEWRTFRRQMLDEWENNHHKLRSIAGRIDRQQRKEKENQSEEEASPAAPGAPMDIAAFNRAMLRSRGVNFPGI